MTACARAQTATSVASGEDFSRQLAALQRQLASERGDVAVHRRLVATMRSLVVEASRSLFDLPRLEAAIEKERARRKAAERTVDALMAWFVHRAADDAAGCRKFAEVAGWRPYPKTAALSAAEDAGLKHGGSIRDDAIKASSEIAPEVVDGKTITAPAYMCRLGKPNVITDTTQERSFAPTLGDAATGRAWVQVRLAGDSAEPVFACGAVMLGSGTDRTDLQFCWKGTAFQVSMDGEEWTDVAGGEVSTDGRATWTPVGVDRVFRRTAAMKAGDRLHCRWDVAHRCRYVRAVLKEAAASGASQMQWEVLKLKAGV
jgi:hypothetical protein